jgi:tetratricopeptide (TPR) repeat protein
MNPRWKLPCFALLFLACSLLLIACGPQKPSTQIPITTSSDEARQLFLQGRDKFENIETAEAAKLFDQAIAKDPDFALAYLWRSRSGGGSEVSQKNREKASGLIGRVSPGERLEILMGLATANGQTALAKLYLDSLLSMFPQDKRVKYWTGLHFRGLLDFKTAVKYYQEAVSLDSMYAPVYNNMGYDYVELGNNEAAEKAFKTYIRLLPNSPNPLDSYAEFLRMQGRFDESIVQYKKVLEFNPSFVSSLTGLGDCYLFMGNAEKAREYYQQYFEKAPLVNEKIGGLYWKAVSYVHEVKIPDALKAFDEYGAFAQKANQFSSAVDALASQGYVLTSFGKPAEGLKKYEDAIQLAKTASLREATRENYLFWSNYWLTFANSEAKNMDKAKECFALFAKDVARRGNPNEKDAITIGEGYLAMMSGRYDEALAKLAVVPPEPSTLSLQGLTYMKKGDKENARKMAEKILQWKTNSLDLAVARSKAKAWK